jgi:hypothetical protein
MKLEPVYLVVPNPKPASLPNRRAFLIAGGTFLAGIGLGGACGYAAGSRRLPHEGKPTLPAPSGNAELDELRRLALVAPIEELTRRWPQFTDAFGTRYRTDEYLPTGIERLVEQVLADASLPQRRTLARVLAQTIQLGEEPVQARLGDRVAALQRVR